MLFHRIFTTLHKGNHNPYFTAEKVSGSSEKLRDVSKVTQQVRGRDRIGTRFFRGQSPYYFLTTLVKFQSEAYSFF